MWKFFLYMACMWKYWKHLDRHIEAKWLSGNGGKTGKRDVWGTIDHDTTFEPDERRRPPQVSAAAPQPGIRKEGLTSYNSVDVQKQWTHCMHHHVDFDICIFIDLRLFLEAFQNQPRLWLKPRDNRSSATRNDELYELFDGSLLNSNSQFATEYRRYFGTLKCFANIKKSLDNLVDLQNA